MSVCTQEKMRVPGVFRWRGLLADSKRPIRLMALALVAIGSIALTFTQLGFVGVGLPGAYLSYTVVLLAPTALAALLFGAGFGFLVGLIAGSALYLHSVVQPLDYYEILFITPFSSIVMFAITGLALGILFAFALRRKPPTWRRVISIIVICVVISWAWAFLFRMNVLFELITQILATNLASGEIDDQQIGIYAEMFGDFDVQVWIDAALMAIACLAADVGKRRVAAMANTMSLRTTFRGWLLAFVLLAFMVTTGASFTIITVDEERSAAERMDNETSYLCDQLDHYEERIAAFDALVAASGLDAEQATDSANNPEFAALSETLSIDELLEDYTTDYDGVVVVVEDGVVMLSNAEGIEVGTPVESYFSDGALELLASAAESGEMVQISYNNSESETAEGGSLRLIPTGLAYLRAAETGDYTVIMTLPASMVFSERTGVMLWTTLIVVVLLLVVFAVATILLTRIVARRIDEANGVLAAITAGDLDARVNLRDSREFASLSDGVNATVSALKASIDEAEERIDRELAAAKAIQASALPRIFPPFPNILRFDVYASAEPAREVGGDFYDFFLIGDSGSHAGRLGFLIADVSGKSIPAALFMMAAKTQIRSYMEAGMELDEAIENANRKLVEENDAGMFVTVFAGVLDYGRGHVVYVNAGHNPPLVWQAGSWRRLEGTSGLPLGLFGGLNYESFELDCEIGDEFLLYTDGVTEAMDESGQLYGIERLEALAARYYYLHPRRLVELVRHDVAEFAGATEQSDDITLLALEHGVPPEVSATLSVRADVEELSRVNSFVHTELDRRLCPVRAQKQLDIAVEELFVNVARYAYPDATPDDPGSVRVSYTYCSSPPSITVEITDDGIPFDPLAKSDAVTPDNVMDVPIGGLGILMAKHSVDEMTYERTDGMNVVTIKKSW